MNKCRRFKCAIIITFIFIFLLAGCGSKVVEGKSSNVETNKTVSLATSPVGLAYYSAATAIADMASQNSDTKYTVKPFSGPNAWVPLLNDGLIELGIISVPDAVWAFEGKNGYKERNENLRALVMGNQVISSGFTVRKDSNIKHLQDLKGKKVASGYSGNQVVNKALEGQLASAGLTWDDVEEVPVTDVGAGLDAFKEGRVDAAFTGHPATGSFLELASSIDLRVLNTGDVDPEDIGNFPQKNADVLAAKVPRMEPVAFKEGFLEEEKTIVQYPNMLVMSADIPDDKAYQIMHILWENYEDLHTDKNWLKHWTHETMFDPDPPVPYHPAVVQFFKDKGVWTEEAEQNQKKLIEEINKS